VYLRDLNRDTARPLAGTEGARDLAFSPDGGWIAFWADQTIRKVRLAGGPPSKLCDVAQAYGISWGSTRLVYSDGGRLFEVSPDGGQPKALNAVAGRVASPFLLPGDGAVLYTAYEKRWTSGDERVMVQSLRPGSAPKLLVRDAADARYLPTGQIAFLRQGTVFVAPFDAEALELRGGAVAVVNEVAQAVASWNSGDLTLAGQLAVSPRGMLAYVPSPTAALPRSEIVAVDRKGQVTPFAAPANSYREHLEVSPSGATLAVSVQTTRSIRLFLYDRVRGTLSAPVADSVDREAVRPVWASNGALAVQFYQGVGSQLAVLRTDAPAPPELVGDSSGVAPSSWSPGGERLVGARDGDLWIYSPDSDSPKSTRLTQTDEVEAFPAWSPDGRWLAYASNVSGRLEVLVQPYPGPGTAITISARGGSAPIWNPKGHELFYVEPRPGEEDDWQMMSVDMTTPLRPGNPLPLFRFSSSSLLMATCAPTSCYSVSADGQEFFALRMLPRPAARVERIRLVFDWFEELRRLVPAS